MSRHFRSHPSTRPGLVAPALAAACFVLAASGQASAQQNTASTDTFRTAAVNRRDGLPISARTRFFNVRNNRDTRNTAEHELLHGMGYAAFYTDFRNKIVVQANGDRHFMDNGANNGTLRVILTAQTTHADPDKRVGGVNQGDTIMRPNQVVNQRAGAFEATPMNDAFGWNARNPDVRITFDESFPALIVPFVPDFHRDIVRAARTAIEGLFGNGAGARFDWTILNVEPRPVRGERQLLRSDVPYRSLATGHADYNAPGESYSLTDLRLQLADAPGTPHPRGTVYSRPANLSAQFTATSAALGLNGSSGPVDLAGNLNMLVLSNPGEIESEFAIEIVQLNLVGTFFSDQGPTPVSLRRTFSQVSTGAFSADPLDAAPGMYEIDSFFDVFTDLSLGNGPFIPANGALYIDYVESDPMGACCIGGDCLTTTPPNCSGVYHGDSSPCVPAPCPAFGACCCGSSCTLTIATDCNAPRTAFAGEGTSCSPYSPTTPCCRGDFNHSGGILAVSVQDLFEFLAAYFGADPCANTNDSAAGPGAPNGVTIQDIFDFLAAYFSGC